MRSSIIRKAPSALHPTHAAMAAGGVARWDRIRDELACPGGGLNIGYAAVDRHLSTAARDRIAFRFVARDGARRDVGYAELARLTNRFANVLRALGVARGERVFVLAGRSLELYVATLGALKHGCAVAPLFSAYGPEPIRTRLAIGGGAVLVTTGALHRRKVAGIAASLPALREVLLIGDGPGAQTSGARDLASLMAGASDVYDAAPTAVEDVALLHFTSGTTGAPKAAVHVHDAAVTHYASAAEAFALRADDVFWCTADPGWVTGMSYGILAPLLHGVTSIVDEGEFDPARWYGLLERERVTVWYTAPTAIRMLMKADAAGLRPPPLPALRHVAAVGEPLHPEGVWWGVEALGQPIHDTWWQSETGGIMLANTPALDIKPGSMGKPLAGIAAAIVARHPDGRVEEVPAAGVEGELALREGWPGMFRGYLGAEERYRRCFAGGWYLSGDLARRDADGYYWFVGRADDVIKSAGHLIGPFEVESALLAHPAVAEAGAIGRPDAVAGETVKAFVALKNGYAPSDALQLELLAHARKRLGAAVAPKEIAFLDSLPRTRSGKIMRRLLKARELGLAEGDTSSLEGAE